jgi:hypothetical protein
VNCPPASTNAAFPAIPEGRERDFFHCVTTTIHTLSLADAAYIAGVVDGEGTVSLVRHHGCENRRPVVSVANTDFALLEYIKAAVGAGRITRKRIAESHHTPSFAFAIYSRQALALLRQITPYLRTCKRARAELLIDSYLLVTPRNGRYTAELSAARTVFEAQFFSIRTRAVPPARREPERGVAHFAGDGYPASAT